VIPLPWKGSQQTNKKDKNRSRIQKYVGIRERRRRIGHVRKKERKKECKLQFVSQGCCMRTVPQDI
jgi:hypothetical protein